MAKQNNMVFWIIGAVVIVILIISSQIPKKTEMIGLNVHYYKDGVEVFPTKGFLGFSIVTPPGGSFDQISLNITGTATGEIPFSNIQITDATPTAFKNALPTTTQSLLEGQSKTLWTSDLMDTVQFESMAQPVRFRVDVSAVDDYTKEIVSKWEYADLTIEPECISHSTYSCYNNDVYWYDSCGTREDKKTECGTAGCSGGVCCTSHTSSSCYSNDVYWYSSCGVREEKKEECGVLGCSGGSCITCTSHDYYSCYSRDVYWYDSCGTREDKKTECGSSSYTGSNYCYSNDVYKDYITKGCSGSGCTSSTSRIKQEECGIPGCSGGVCNQPEGAYTGEHWDTAGSGNNYPWGLTTYGNYIWIANVENKIYKYSKTGTYISSWDTSGEVTYNTLGVATDGSNIWVLEWYRDVHKYDMNGNYVGESWDTYEQSGGETDNPQGITTDGNYIWIFDYGDNEVHKYSMTGTYISKWALHSGNGGGRDLTTNGNYIWVTEISGSSNPSFIYKYSMTGTYIKNYILNSDNYDIRGVTTDGNYIWTTDYTNKEVYKYIG